MLGRLGLFSVLLMLKITAFSQVSQMLPIFVTDQNGDLITEGFGFLTDSTGKKVAEIEVGKIQIPIINIGVGIYVLEIQSPGFKLYRKNIEIKSGQNKIEVRLEVEELKADVSVSQSERERRIDEAFSEYLSEKEIAALPESGEAIKEELQKRYGDDILIRIDGDFEGSQVPSRAEIASIKIVRNSFDAEFHEIAGIIIDIQTKVVTSGIHGFANFSLNNSTLNARNPFDFKRQPQRANNLIAFLSGPLIKNKTSFSLSTFVLDRTVTQNFIGTGIETSLIVPQKTGQRLAFTSFTIKTNLPQNHILDFKYQNTDLSFQNIGISGFDLPERGAALTTVQHKFSISESGTFKNNYVNDLKISLSNVLEKIVPKTTETTVLILNAFNKGSSGTKNRIKRNKIEFSDNLNFDSRQNSFKLGFEITYEKLHSLYENNLNGTFIFLDLTEFRNRKPSQFSQTTGKTEFGLSRLRSAFYFQDYFKLNKAAQLSLGLRYERQNDLSDNNNLSPRFGYVWSPEKSGKFIFRGGIGLFYEWLDTATISAIISNDGRQGEKLIIRNPSFPNPSGGGTNSQTLPPSISRFAGDLQTPSIFAVQNGFNYKFNKSLTVEGIYNFKRSFHNFRSRNINAPIGGVRPDENFGVIQLLESGGNLQEQSFEVKTNSYFKGINLYVNYKLAKTTADFSGALNLPTDNYNIRFDKGVTDLDQRHRLNISCNFDILKTINVSPSFRLESGLPYTITTGKDDNDDTVFNDRPAGIGRNTNRGEFLKQFDLRFRWKLPTKYLGVKKEDKRRFLSLNANVKNLFNSTNLANYVGIQTSPYFQRATSARTARSIELGLAFGF